MSRLINLGFIHLTATVVSLFIITDIYTGGLGLDTFSKTRLLNIGSFIILFLMISCLISLFESLLKAKHFVNQQTGQINVAELWRATFINPLPGVMVAFIMLLGIIKAQDISEIYRTSVTHWHDAELWRLESGCFNILNNFLLDHPFFWDSIYFSLWIYLILAFSILYKAKKSHYFGVFTISMVMSFFITRWSALKYATAGPVFYQPDFFNISGTISSRAQESLLLYMSGEIAQNGFIPGTMGMPSLHIGLTVIATLLLSCLARWTLWLTVPWTALIWLSTVMLGWHYLLDGLGGIVVAAFSMIFAHCLLQSSWLNFSNYQEKAQGHK